MQHHFNTPVRLRQTAGFTLVEMLISVGILIILTTLSAAVYTTTASADRIRSSARQVQSALGGARDRQIKILKTNPLATRGLRLLVDAADPTTVTSMVYVGSDLAWTDGQIQVGREDYYTSPGTSSGPPDLQADYASPIRTVRGGIYINPSTGDFTVPGWLNLYNQGLLVDGSRIQIPAKSNNWYTVLTYPLYAPVPGTNPEMLVLTSDYRGTPTIPFGTVFDVGPDLQPGRALVDDDQDGTVDNPSERGAVGSDDVSDIHATGVLDYQLELKPTVLPSQEPLRLSGGIAIDLYNSVIPSNWYEQRSLPKGTPVPPTDQRWDPTQNMGMGAYVYNGWGVWSIEGTDPSNGANDIYRQYSPRMDIMFSPQGTVTGALATMGMIHLRLAEIQDIGEARDPANPEAAPMLYSTIFTQTGYVATFPVDTTDVLINSTGMPGSDGLADDRLKFARIGGTVGR